VCGTPIGNLGDVTDRLREALAAVEVIYAEDTRRVAKLLRYLGLTVEARSLFTGNEKARTEEALARLAAGADVALVSDAGMPAISDPGAWLVSEAHRLGIPVTVIPGPSSVITALVHSGFPADRFVFEGFLPRRGKERQARLERIATDDRTTVLFASPKRLAEDLAEIRGVLGDDRMVAVTRELTKLHEEVWIGRLADAIERWAGEVKGEVTMVVAPGPADLEDGLSEAVAAAQALIDGGESISGAARRIADETGVSRREVYQSLIRSEAGSDRSNKRPSP
jgi:16S rRNA (cytidine1402-2'-O)-methyltransferase